MQLVPAVGTQCSRGIPQLADHCDEQGAPSWHPGADLGSDCRSFFGKVSVSWVTGNGRLGGIWPGFYGSPVEEG